MSVLIDLGLLVIILVLAPVTPRWAERWFKKADAALDRFARRRVLAAVSVGLAALLIRAALLPVMGVPRPGVHDEFSYLLAADTFAHGRLTNPTHPMWVHFESFHIIHQPTYMSKYPPAQGLILAFGQVVAGVPWMGVWLSMGAMCWLICWMLQAWLPPKWALAGGLLVVARYGVTRYWMNSYWGGAPAAIGGALLLGALPRIMRRQRIRDTLLLGLGLAILANSRPYEGLLVSVPAGIWLLVWMLGKKRPAPAVALTRILLPLAVVLGVAGSAMAHYNFRVTGDPLRTPYQAHDAQYAAAPLFLWQPLPPEPVYRHDPIRSFYVGWWREEYLLHRSSSFALLASLEKLVLLWNFFCGFLLTIPALAMIPWMLGNRRARSALVVEALLVAGLLLVAVCAPHYAAPAAALFLFSVMQGFRRLQFWSPGGRPVGRFLTRMLFVACLLKLPFDVAFPPQSLRAEDRFQEFASRRARVEDQLRASPGRHLVIVRYSPRHWPHSEWVFNDAAIDQANVVWARDMGPDENRKLAAYFSDRKPWLLEGDAVPPAVTPFR